MILHIFTEDLNADMKQDFHLFDTSNFPKDHPLYSNVNCKVVGTMKSETAEHQAVSFCGLRSKMYSLHVPSLNIPKMTAKGIKKSYVEKNLKHELYEDVLRYGITTSANFCVIRSKDHIVRTERIGKICLSAMDDKRYVLKDGVNTLAHGHFRIDGDMLDF
jgi:hypothetical protein